MAKLVSYDDRFMQSTNPFVWEDETNKARLDRLKETLPMAMEKLTYRQQGVIYEIYVLGRTQTQVADRRGVNKSTICRTHQRALERLRKHLELFL